MPLGGNFPSMKREFGPVIALLRISGCGRSDSYAPLKCARSCAFPLHGPSGLSPTCSHCARIFLRPHELGHRLSATKREITSPSAATTSQYHPEPFCISDVEGVRPCWCR